MPVKESNFEDRLFPHHYFSLQNLKRIWEERFSSNNTDKVIYVHNNLVFVQHYSTWREIDFPNNVTLVPTNVSIYLISPSLDDAEVVASIYSSEDVTKFISQLTTVKDV